VKLARKFELLPHDEL